MVFRGKVASFVRRARAALSRSRLDRELREEIAQHVEMRRQQLIADGTDPDVAGYEARRAFGNRASILERTRDIRSFVSLDAVLQDVRFGARLLRRTPLFTAVAILSLATGLGAAVAVFNVADAVLFRSLEVRDPGQLRAFRGTVHLGGATKVLDGVDAATLARIQEGADFATFLGFRSATDVTIEAPGNSPRSANVEFVSAEYFDVTGVPFVFGRGLAPFDQNVTPAPVVISERLWSSYFRNDQSILGRPVALNGQSATIVGVVRAFRGLVAESPSDVFAPLSASAAIDPVSSATTIRLIARLTSPLPLKVAEERLAALYKGVGPSLLRAGELRVELYPAARGVSDVRGPLQRPLWLGLALVGVLLLVACANTAGLLLSRFVSRQTEFGVRAAIGAGRARLARQLLVEAVLLALVAAVIGLYAGWLGAPLLMRAMPQSGSATAFDLRFDWRLVAFTASIAIVSAAAAAAASLLRLWRAHPNALVGGESRTLSRTSQRVARTLIGVQVACCLLLAVGAVTMSRTLTNLLDVHPGFDPTGTFVVSVNANGLLPAPDAAAAYHTQLHQRIIAAPGVLMATMAQLGPLTTAMTTGTVEIAGFSPATDEDRWTRMFFVGPHYFQTLDMPLVRGRGISVEDAGSRARVAVVNERFATFYFGSSDNAIDRIVNGSVRIVGIVADARYNSLREAPPRAMFVPYAPVQRASMAHIVRSAGDPAAAMLAVRNAIAAHDERLRPKFSTAEELLGANVAREQFFATIATVLSLLAVTLACAGLYGAVAYGVSQRTSELAVRIALGATPRRIASLILSDPLRTTIAGVAAGIPASYLVMQSAGSLLFEVDAFDPLTILTCAALLLVAATAAALWPACLATRIDPVRAFRSL
jgi:predicted permease